MLAASMAPSPDAPAPTRVWISSIKRIISPLDCTTSLMTAFKRSSNSPLYLAPAISAPISSEYNFLVFKFSGMSPLTKRWAKPSAMAVLPTPASPIRIGVFLVLLERICSTRRISSSRPITGSSFPWRAMSFKFFAYLFSALYVSSLEALFTLLPWCNSAMALFNPFSVMPASFRI